MLPTEESDHVITLISYELNFLSNYASIVKFKSQKVGSRSVVNPIQARLFLPFKGPRVFRDPPYDLRNY